MVSELLCYDFVVPYVPLQREVLAVNMWSSAQLIRPKGEPYPL